MIAIRVVIKILFANRDAKRRKKRVWREKKKKKYSPFPLIVYILNYRVSIGEFLLGKDKIGFQRYKEGGGEERSIIERSYYS